MRKMTGTVKVAEIDYYQVCLILNVNEMYSSRTFRKSIKKRLAVIGMKRKKRHSSLWGEKKPKEKLTPTRHMSNGSSARPSDVLKIN